MSVRVAGGAWLLALMLCGNVCSARLGAQGSATASPPRIRAGAVVQPDTVRIGDLFALVVTLEVPAGATVQWPSIGDSVAMVAMRGPARVTSEVQGGVRRERAEYALAAWNVGALPLGVPDITVRTDSDVVAVPLRNVRVVVATVLPADTSLHVPKPLRDPFPQVVPWWELWWPAAALVAVLGLLWWLWRRRRRRVVVPEPAPLDVFVRAMHDFDRLQRLALVDAGERGRGVALAVEILRTYLAARSPRATLALTSPELMQAISDDDRVPHDRLMSLLLDADFIKFAHHGVSRERARALQDEARAVVEVIEEAERRRREQEEASRRDAERLQREAADREEDRARRRVRRKKAGAT